MDYLAGNVQLVIAIFDRFLYHYYIRFWLFCGVKIHKILLKYTIYSSYQSKNPLYKPFCTNGLYMLIFHQIYDLF